MQSTARFRDATESPRFGLDSFLLQNSKARLNGFDEWNPFSVPDDALEVTQFKGKFNLTRPVSPGPEQVFNPSTDAAARGVPPVAHPVTINIPLNDELVSSRLSRIKRNIASAEHRRLVHSTQVAKKSANRKGHGLDAGLSSAALSSLRDVSSPAIEAPPPSLVSPAQLKGHKFSLGSAESGTDPAVADSLLQPVDSAGYGLSSLISNNISVAVSEAMPIIDRPLQVHKQLMGWKLINPNTSRGGARASFSRGVRRASSAGGPIMTLEQMGYMSESEDSRLELEEEARVSRRHVDAVLNIVR